MQCWHQVFRQADFRQRNFQVASFAENGTRLASLHRRCFAVNRDGIA